MSSDDPFSNSGDSARTVIRPTPGGRRELPSSPGMPSQSPVPPAVGQPASPPPLGANQSYVPQTDILGAPGINPLVDSAAALLALAAQLRNMASQPDVAGLREHVVQQIKLFEQQARAKGATPEMVLTARYVLCAFLDEIVLNTPWGSESVWSAQSLLSSFHKETWGGEKFFMIQDRMLQDPASNINMIELMFLCLSIGFEGKYRVLEQGHIKLMEVQENLFRAIRYQRGDVERDLSPSWQGVQNRRNALIRYVPLWVVGALSGVLLLVTFAGFLFVLERSSAPIYEELEMIGQNGTGDGR